MTTLVHADTDACVLVARYLSIAPAGVRVILDGNLPRGLVRLLSGHETHTIHVRRWSDLDDGASLAACENDSDAFVRMDQSLRFQRNLHGRRLAVVLLYAHSNRLVDVKALVPELLAVLPNAVRGEVTFVGV